MRLPAMPALAELHALPQGFFECGADHLQRILPGPTLVHLPGRRPQPLFVSALLHGNEDVGLFALQQVLARYREGGLPRALSFFIGNVSAARAGLRHLDDQPDYNRVWPGTLLPESAETQRMSSVVEAMRGRRPFASIDLHNNTGLNPHYGCVTRTEPPFLHLAALFSHTVVHFGRPPGTQAMAFAGLCPAVTCECGKVGSSEGVMRAAEFVDACLHLRGLPTRPLRVGEIHLFRTVAALHVPQARSMSFDGSAADFVFAPDLDHCNFRELSAAALLAHAPTGARLLALDDAGADVAPSLLDQGEGRITLRAGLMPAMLTRDERVVRQDCLGYLMRRVEQQT